MNEKPYCKSYKSFESVQDYIFKMYAEHTLEPGDCIFETEIAKQLNLSRTPVRDALGRLVANGFLEQQRGRRGYFLPHLTVNDMEDAYCARECMEVKIGYLAAQKANNYDIQKLQTINEFELSFSGENSNTQNRLEYMKGNIYTLQ